ncbi:MAG: hypothetical protein KJ709_08260 [Nanoarchaeota archaeon]|nr:hypothetical protein [Nanoarchaeota archaeon]
MDFERIERCIDSMIAAGLFCSSGGPLMDGIIKGDPASLFFGCILAAGGTYFYSKMVPAVLPDNFKERTKEVVKYAAPPLLMVAGAALFHEGLDELTRLYELTEVAKYFPDEITIQITESVKAEVYSHYAELAGGAASVIAGLFAFERPAKAYIRG